MNDIIESNDNDNDIISWITSSAQGWGMPLGESCLDCKQGRGNEGGEGYMWK